MLLNFKTAKKCALQTLNSYFYIVFCKLVALRSGCNQSYITLGTANLSMFSNRPHSLALSVHYKPALLVISNPEFSAQIEATHEIEHYID